MAGWKDFAQAVPAAANTWIATTVVPTGQTLTVEEIVLSYSGTNIPIAGGSAFEFGYANDAVGTAFNALWLEAVGQIAYDRYFRRVLTPYVIPAGKFPIFLFQTNPGTLPAVIMVSLSGYRV